MPNKELTVTRVIDAPRERVWEAWTDEKQVAQWWGLTVFTNPRCEWDARQDGKVRVDMRAPDGTIYPMDGVFTEMDPSERLVIVTHALNSKDGKPQMELVSTITFEAQGNKTKLTMHGVFTMIMPEMMAAAEGGQEGWSQSFDKLAELVEKK